MSKLACPTTCLLLILLPLSAFGQPLTASQTEKLDPRLRSVLARELPQLDISGGAPEAVPVMLQPSAPGKQTGEDRYAVFVETSRPDLLPAIGIQPNATFPSFATARLTPAELAELVRIEEIEYIAVPPRAHPTNDVAAAETGAKLPHRGALNRTVYQGQGTLTCIIDTGIDWSHRDFRSPTDSTRSRILYLWDQTIHPQNAESTPSDRGGDGFSGLDYGVEYTRAAIEDELDGQPENFVRSRDSDGHGTHVAGTAAGNGASLTPQKHVGMAPRSELVVVKAGNAAFPTTNIVDGLSYCGKVADERRKPVVVNLSLGSHDGPHDGTSQSARAVDSFVDSGTYARLVVSSAGNEGEAVMHYSAPIKSTEGVDIQFEIPSYSPLSGRGNDNLKIDLWFDGAPDIMASVLYEDTLVASQPGDGSNVGSSDHGTAYIYNHVNTENSDRNVHIQIYDGSSTEPPGEGTWKIRLVNNSETASQIHAWMYDHTIGENTEVAFTGGDTDYTIGSPGTASKAITVGSYAHRWLWPTDNGSAYTFATDENRSDDISAFSSKGPRRDGLQKPDITAPGQGVVSALSSDATPSSKLVLPGGEHFIKKGTSMAAPVVAGGLALLMQETNTLTHADAYSVLTGSARSDSYTQNIPSPAWGYGKLDVFGALAALSGGSQQRQILSYDGWESSGSSLRYTSDDQFAFRFTPTLDGQLPGAFLHTRSDLNLNQPLELHIWSDDGSGKPDSPLGSPASVEPGRLTPSSWNYVDLTSTDVSVAGGSTYHLVVSVRGTSDTLSVSTDDSSVDGRTSYHTTYGGWVESNTDLRIRPEVAPLASGANSAPLFTSELPDTTIVAPATLSFDYIATDANGDPITFSLAEGPTDAAVSSRGELTWSPSNSDLGTHTIQVQASDGTTDTDSRSAVVTVEGKNNPPGKVTTLSPADGSQITLEGDPAQTLDVRWNAATDADGDEVQYSWTLVPSQDTTDIWYESAAVKDTFLTVSYDTLASILTDHGVPTGSSADLHHKLLISDGHNETTSGFQSLQITRGAMTAALHETDIPSRYSLEPNYPNPFNPTTAISYTLPEQTPVTVRIYDALGQHVRELLNTSQPPGRYTVTFDASQLPSGIYFYQIEAGSFLRTRTMTLVK